MRIVKKIIRKLYHLIWFLCVFFVVSLPVNAELANPNTNGTGILTPYSVTFADNTNNVLTRVPSGWDDANKRGWSNPLTLNGASIYGANVAFDTLQPFVNGYTYAISILIGFPSNSVYPIPTGNKVCVAENLNNALTRFDSRYGFSCPSAQMHGTTGATASWNVTDSNTGNQLYFGILTYVFTSNVTATSVTMSFNSSSYLSNTTIYFGGYMMEVLSDNKNLTQQQITSAVQSSGLATANSVSQVQSSINQIQQDINSSADNIINSNEQNTQDIINNQNSNTEQQIESQKVCNIIDRNSIVDDNVYLTPTNTFSSNENFGVTGYINIFSKEINVLKSRTGTASLCFYTKQKKLLGCYRNSSFGTGFYTPPSNSYYMRASIEKGDNIPVFELCSNGNQALNDSVNDLNDNITDSNVDSSDSTIDNLKDKIPTNSVISDLLLLPVRFLQNFVNALGSSCSRFSLGSLYGTELFMPCINIENYLGSGIWTTIDLIISGMFVYALRKKFIEIYENLTNLKNGGNEVD